MAKKAETEKAEKKEKAPHPPVTLTYDLFDLPTSQHKAGLAGLLLQITSMKNRKKTCPSFEWDEAFPSTRVKITFTEDTTKCLFDDIYDAEYVNGLPREKPFKNKKTKEDIPWIARAPFTKTNKKGEETTIEGYVYKELNPAFCTLNQYLPKGGDWLKLWKDLIWQVIRDSTKKAPFIKRGLAKNPPEGAVTNEDEVQEESVANVTAEDKGSGDGSTWADIVKFDKGLKNNEFALGKLSSALFLGAQSDNAESIAFTGRLDENLLLHFWVLAAMVYVPRFVDVDGGSFVGKQNKEDKTVHFCLVVPEISDLKKFLAYHPELLQKLSDEKQGFRPKEAIVDVAAESGLSFIDHLARLVPQSTSDKDIQNYITGVDYFHLNKKGNNVRFLSTGRIAWDRRLAEKYHKCSELAKNPLFRSSIMTALVRNETWYKPFLKHFLERDHSSFVSNGKSSNAFWFSLDARNFIGEIEKENLDLMKNDRQSVSKEDRLAMLVNGVVRTYLIELSQKKSGIKLDNFKISGDENKTDWKNLPKEFTEARSKLGESLFLQFRSRKDQAFIEHFSQTFFGVKQFINDADFADLTKAVLNEPENVKTLTLMAISANS